MATYDECVDAWGKSQLLMGEIEEFTARRNVERARRLSPYIGGKQVEEITVFDIENALIDLKQRGNRRNGKGLSPTTVKYAYKHGKSAVKWAILHDMVSVNPFDKVTGPKGKSPEAVALETEQAVKLNEAIMLELNSCMFGIATRDKVINAACCVFVIMALATGARRGELLALNWGHVRDGGIDVVCAVKADGHIGATKTAKGKRFITLTEDACKILAAYKDWLGQVARIEPTDSTPVLSTLNGRLSGNTIEHWWQDRRALFGFEGVKLHSLRHTHATLLIASGCDIKTVQTRMGHSSAVMTLDVYSHAVPKNDELAAASINSMLRGDAR